MKRMQRLSTKMIIVASLLVFGQLGGTIASSIAIETQEQHIAITEIIGEQRVAMEQIIHMGNDIDRLRVFDQGGREELEDIREQIGEASQKIDKVINSLNNRETQLISGEMYQLRFRGEFEELVFEAVEKLDHTWMQTKDDLLTLMDTGEHDPLVYQVAYNSFQDNIPELLALSDRLVLLCMEEANQKRMLSSVVQMASTGVSVVLLGFVFLFSRKHFYAPLRQMMNTFEEMGKGSLNLKMIRTSNDEFREVYDKFNAFVDQLSAILSVL